MEFISRVSAHRGQNCEVCLSAHGCLPGTLRYFRNLGWAILCVHVIIILLSLTAQKDAIKEPRIVERFKQLGIRVTAVHTVILCMMYMCMCVGVRKRSNHSRLHATRYVRVMSYCIMCMCGLLLMVYTYLWFMFLR